MTPQSMTVPAPRTALHPEPAADGGPARQRNDAVAWIEWLMLLGYAVASAIAVSIALMVAVLLTSSAAGAQTITRPPATAPDAPAPARPELAPEDAVARPTDSAGTALMLRTTQGWVSAPLQSTDARLAVTGTTVRGVVAQRFVNPGTTWMEGVYVFPLPEDAAVDHLRMRIGQRTVEGRITEKDSARRDYERAKADGRQASLVEAQRPNVFTTRVANIAPGAEVSIEIEYQQVLALKDGYWKLRFPTVVAPRYQHLPAPAADGERPRAGTANAVVEAPTVLPDGPRVNPVKIAVTIDAGVPVSVPRSGSHPISVTPADGARQRVELAAGAVADRDFVLEWQPLAGSDAKAALRVERHRDKAYGLLLVAPPAPSRTPEMRTPREVTFIVDTSGSMSGTSMDQARRALVFGLERLQDGDRFNVIEFNSTHTSLYREPQPLDERSRSQAIAWAKRLKSQGGTEMRGALEQALAAPVLPGYVRQVVFMTDGAVGYEDEMLTLIERRLGERRLFTVGIGSAPNSWFMRKAAESGRGTFTYIGRIDEVERRMAELFAKLAQPVLTDVSVRFEGGQLAEPLPPLGELYAGEPLALRARFDTPPQSVAVSGVRGGQRWEQRVPAAAAADSGLHVLWARGRIEALNDQIRAAAGGSGGVDALRAEVTTLGLDHHLVTPYTSLLAVDTTPVRPADAPLASGAVPQNLPDGWQHDAVFGGELAQGATPAALQLALGALLLMAGSWLWLGAGRRGAGNLR